ncbi:uncharacterized protein [Rhodnius prolixus]|uniref:Uncharacterized protein n=1 Tax=Rhodnius prolixus TaxID=13249 RepID=T1HCJ9_RHOPR
MLGILYLLSCVGAVLCGTVEVAGPFVQDAARTSIAYGNTAFLERYGFGTPFGGAAFTTPYLAGVQGGVVGAPLAAHVAHSGVVAPFLAARTGVAAPFAAVGAPVAAVSSPLLAARTAVAAPAYDVAPVAAVTAAPFTAHAAVAAPVAAVSSPLLATRTAVAAQAYDVAPVAAVTAAPFTAHAAVAAPFAQVAAAPVVSTVSHVPGVAQVPVTKIEAHQALIQNVVDVAKTNLASRKFEIRRPAIQKEFYDIEERVSVRPAGSAVVELDQPISKNQRGPTVISPAPEPLVSSAPLRALPVAHAVQSPAFLPSLGAVPVHSYPGTPLQPVIPSVGVTAVPTRPVGPVGPSTPRPVLPDLPESDDTESISVENPEFGRARFGQQQQIQRAGQLDGVQIQRIFEQSRAQAEAGAQQEIQARAKILADERAQLEVQARARAQAEERAQQEILARARTLADERAQQEVEARARIQAQQQLIEQQQFFEHQQQQLLARLRSQQPLQRQSVEPAPVRENVEAAFRSGEVRQGGVFSGGLARVSAQAGEIASVRNLPEVEHSNQARLIALLTERGPVTEVRSGNGFDGRVRARVLSATPAPLDALAQDEKVSTRRVVVNRPIQTVQEVDVVEPFTKIERVAVQQPALVKTARLGVANVPTAVPVHTYTHAHYAF